MFPKRIIRKDDGLIYTLIEGTNSYRTSEGCTYNINAFHWEDKEKFNIRFRIDPPMNMDED